MANVVEIILRGVDQYSRGFTTAIKDMTSLKSAAGSLYNSFLGAATAAAGALTTLTVQAIRNADEMGKMAQRTQIPVETLSRLVHAAQMSNVSAQQLETGIRALSKTMSEALSDSSSDSAQRFAALGISLTDAQGKMVSADQILLQLATRFSNFAENAAKADLAMKFFGKSGTDMLPMLNESAAGIRKLGDEAVVVTAEMAAQADELGDNLDRLRNIGRAWGSDIATQILPALVQLTTQTISVKKESGSAVTFIEFLIGALKALYIGTAAVIAGFEIFGSFLARTASVFVSEFKLAVELGIVALRAFLDVLKEAWGMLQGIGRAIVDLGGALQALAQRDFAAAKRLAIEALGELASASFDVSEKIKTGLASIADAYTEYIRKSVVVTKAAWDAMVSDALRSALTLVGMADTLFRPAPGPAAAGPGAPSPGRKPTDDAALYLQQVQLTNDKILKFEQDLGRKMKSEYEKQLRDRIAGQQAALGATGNLFGNLASLSAAFGKKNFALTQAFSIAQAVVNTAGGVVRALNDYQFPYSIIVGALVAAAGAVQIATIAATKPSGVAHGGLDYVPSTGTYILERGEAVLQARQNQALTEFLEGRESNRPIVVNVDGEPLFRLLSDGLRSGRIEVPTRALV